MHWLISTQVRTSFQRNLRQQRLLQMNKHRFHDLDGLPAWFLAGDGVVENNVRGCAQINQCVGCTR